LQSPPIFQPVEARDRLRLPCELSVRGATDNTTRSRYPEQAFTLWRSPAAALSLAACTYRYGNRSFEALVDGYTGNVSGDAPLSAWKVSLVLLLAALALGLALWLVVRLVAAG
jgi:hypothetical protein